MKFLFFLVLLPEPGMNVHARYIKNIRPISCLNRRCSNIKLETSLEATAAKGAEKKTIKTEVRW